VAYVPFASGEFLTVAFPQLIALFVASKVGELISVACAPLPLKSFQFIPLPEYELALEASRLIRAPAVIDAEAEGRVLGTKTPGMKVISGAIKAAKIRRILKKHNEFRATRESARTAPITQTSSDK
jgi:hypothetical protein